MKLGEGILGQASALRVLERAVKNDRVASSYLFEGPSGVGKARAATALARAVLCDERRGEGCGACVTCERIAKGSHPDVRVFAPRDEGSRNIQVEHLREHILPFAQYAPFEASAAFLIFPEADVSFPEVHPESANALLKTLEEPRARVHFVLLSERPDRLLPTIRSRCQSVRFHRLTPGVLERILSDAGVREDDRGPAIALADGRADRAIALATSGASQEVFAQAIRIDRAIESGKPGSLVDIAEELAKSDALELALEALSTFYRDVATYALGAKEIELAFRHERDAIRERAERLDPARAATRVELVRKTVDTFERNANKQIALDALLFALAAT